MKQIIKNVIKIYGHCQETYTDTDAKKFCALTPDFYGRITIWKLENRQTYQTYLTDIIKSQYPMFEIRGLSFENLGSISSLISTFSNVCGVINF